MVGVSSDERVKIDGRISPELLAVVKVPLCLLRPDGRVRITNQSWSSLFGDRGTLQECVESSDLTEIRRISTLVGSLATPCILREWRSGGGVFSGGGASAQMLFVPEIGDDVDLVMLIGLTDGGEPHAANAGAITRLNPSIGSGVEPFPPQSVPALTEREVQVVTLLAKGLRTGGVGAQLGISEATVHAHVRNAMKKAHVQTRAGLVAFAMSEGVVRS